MRLGLFIAALAAVTLSAQAANARWAATWAAPPTLPLTAGPPAYVSPVLSNQTVVETLRLSAGGSRLRIRFGNEYGAKPVAIGRARVALLTADGKTLPGSERLLTFTGASSAKIPAHGPLFSDPVDLPTRPLATLEIRLYLPGDVGPCPCHAFGGQVAQLSPPGDFTDRPFTAAGTTQARVFLSGVEVDRVGSGPVIVAFGDSITDGAASTPGTNHRWPDRLAERLVQAKPGGGAAVVNTGIGGNRVLTDAGIPIFGESALARFDRDVLAQPAASHLVILEGVNDFGSPPIPSAQDIIAGYRQLIARAHAHGLKVIFGTILPYKGAAYFKPDGEAGRQAVNQWIRTSREPDGVIDFDAAMRDPADPTRMRAGLQSGDWLHPNDAGYRVMGDAIDLSLFR